MKSILTAAFLLILPFAGIAQHTQTNRGNQQWLQHYASFGITERVHVGVDGGFRTSNWFQNPAAYIVRAGVQYNVHPRWRVGAGFAHSGTFVDNELYRLEYRPHQEVVANHEFSNVELTNRLRIEERVQRVLFNDSLVPFLARVRFKFQVMAPVLALSKAHPERQLFIVLADEFLLNAGKILKHNILDQNRMMVGPAFRVSEKLDIALLYNYIFGTTVKPNVFTQEHVLWLTFSHRFSFWKEKETPSSIRSLGE